MDEAFLAVFGDSFLMVVSESRCDLRCDGAGEGDLSNSGGGGLRCLLARGSPLLAVGLIDESLIMEAQANLIMHARFGPSADLSSVADVGLVSFSAPEFDLGPHAKEMQRLRPSLASTTGSDAVGDIGGGVFDTSVVVRLRKGSLCGNL